MVRRYLRDLIHMARIAVARPKRVLATVHGVLTGPPGECPCCGYEGVFWPENLAPSRQCPKCLSLHRQRLLALAMQRGFVRCAGRRVLHFAHEQSVERLIRPQSPASYQTADITPGRADLVIDIEAMGLPDASVDVVVALGVLEHVDDRKALADLFRILTPGGQLVAQVPIIEGWERTYEDDTKRTAEDQTLHFGQPGHVRYYGRDFRERLSGAGFSIDEFTAEGADSVRYRLKAGAKIFLGTKTE